MSDGIKAVVQEVAEGCLAMSAQSQHLAMMPAVGNIQRAMDTVADVSLIFSIFSLFSLVASWLDQMLLVLLQALMMVCQTTARTKLELDWRDKLLRGEKESCKTALLDEG